MGVNAEPLVSVIVPAYNAADYLERALGSAVAQTMPNLEVIVVNDASSDATLELARQVAARDFRVRVLNNDRNSGLAVSRNRAINAARGEWIALLDADDAWSPERLERMLAVANDADVVSDDLHIISSSFIDPGKPKSLSLLLRQGLSITAPRRLGLTEFTRHDLGLLMPLIRRSFLQQHDLKFNPNLDHVVDFHLYFEMLALNARWLQMTDAYYFHYRHTGNMSSNTVGLAEDIHKSSEVLLNHPVVAADAALGATLQHRMREWHSHAAFATVYSLLRQRRGSELARLLSEKPSYLWLTISKIVRSLYRRMLRVFAAGLDSRKVYT